MTEKRFTYDSKTVSILKDGEFWLDGNIDTACNNSEICNELNNLADENEQLQKDCTALICHNQEYRKKNEELKQELSQLKNNNSIEISRRCEAIEAFKERFEKKGVMND